MFWFRIALSIGTCSASAILPQQRMCLASAGISAWGVMELVGNGWEWTSTPFAPLQGFQAWARTYPGYSTDFFDDAHDVVFGASWATDLKLLRPSFRNWYRRNYPYPFTSFRVVRS